MGGITRCSWLILAGAVTAFGASCSGAEKPSGVTDAGPDTSLHDAGSPDSNDATDGDSAATCPSQFDAFWSFTSSYTCDDLMIDCGTPSWCRFPVAVQFGGYCSICNFDQTYDAAACRDGRVEIDDPPDLGWRPPDYCCDCPPPDAGE